MTSDRPENETSETCEPAALYRLMSWLSPAYPVGAFSYSGGLEWAVEAGDVKDAATLADWLAAMIAHGLSPAETDACSPTISDNAPMASTKLAP